MNMILAILGLGGSELVMIGLAVVLLFFGGKKIPQLMRGLGQGINEFKKGANEEPHPPDKAKAKLD